MRVFRYGLIGVLAVMAYLAVAWIRHDRGIDPLPEDQIEQSLQVQNVTFMVTKDGKAYRVDDHTQRWHFHEQVFDSVALNAAYRTDGADVYRINQEQHQEFKTRRRFQEGFETLTPNMSGLRQLLGPERGWGELTLQSPRTPDLADYVQLRNDIMGGQDVFLDAIVVPDGTRAHSGTTSLLCKVPAPTRRMICSKASISSPLVYFKQGDNFWFSAWYYAQDALPSSLIDLEADGLPHRAGIRLLLNAQGQIYGELKALDKPLFLQPTGKEVTVPINQWVSIKLHVFLAETNAGLVQIWQDGRLIVDQRGPTLPLRRAIYNSLEIGIPSHSYGSAESKLWVDDIEVSDDAL